MSCTVSRLAAVVIAPLWVGPAFRRDEKLGVRGCEALELLFLKRYFALDYGVRDRYRWRKMMIQSPRTLAHRFSRAHDWRDIAACRCLAKRTITRNWRLNR